MTQLTKRYKQTLQGNNQEQLNEQFLFACVNGQLDIVRYLLTSSDLSHHVDIHLGNNDGLQLACAFGHLPIVQYLLTSPDLQNHANIHARNDKALWTACFHGWFDIINYLLTSTELTDHANVHWDDEFLFRALCQAGMFEVATHVLSFGGVHTINFQCTEYNIDWAIKEESNALIMSMMRSLYYGDSIEYVDCLLKVKKYSIELLKQIQDSLHPNVHDNITEETVIHI